MNGANFASVTSTSVKTHIGLMGMGVLVVLALASCERQASKPTPEAELPPVSLDIRRTEVALKQLYLAHRDERPDNPRDRVGVMRQLSAMFEQHAAADYAFYSDLLADRPDAPRDEIGANVAAFALNTMWQGLIDTVLARYPADYDFAGRLERPLRRFRQQFPNERIPPIRTYVTGYQEPGLQTMDPGFVDTSFIGIGLHYHMGPGFSYPRDLPRYLRRRFDSTYIPVRVVEGLIDRVLPPLDPATAGRSPQLVDHVMHGGIRMALLARLLPEVADSVRWGHTAAQSAWVQANEAIIYNKLVPHLFDDESVSYRTWVGEGPGTPSVAAEAPARLAAWLGARAIDKYLKEHPEATLAELARRTDYQRLFQECGYKPR